MTRAGQRISSAIGLIVVIGLAVGVRVPFMTQPVRYDEAFTLMHYVVPPGELTHYTMVNQHLLHTLAVWASTASFGFGLPALRLPAMLAGVAAVPLAWRVARRLTGPAPGWLDGRGGWLAAAGVAVHPFLVLFSTNARGYTLMVVATLTMTLAVESTLRRRGRGWGWVAVWCSLGLWTVPVMALPAAGLLTWWAVERLARGRTVGGVVASEILPMGLAIAAMTSLAYAPTLMREGGWEDVFDNRIVRSRSAEQFYHDLPDKAAQAYRHLMRDVPGAVRIGWGGLLLAGTLSSVLAAGRRRSAAAWFVPMVTLGVAGLFLIKQSFPFNRNWIFVIPWALIVADVGLTHLIGWTRRAIRRQLFGHPMGSFAAPVVIVAVATAAGWRLVRENTIAAYNDTGTFRQAERVADWLSHRVGDDAIVSRVPLIEPLRYQMWRRGREVTVMRQDPDDIAAWAVVAGEDDRNPDVARWPVVWSVGEVKIHQRRGDR